MLLYSSHFFLRWCYQYFMLIRLDRHLCAEFSEKWISDINLNIIQSGCAGSKITLEPRTENDNRVASDIHNTIRCWVLPELSKKLDGAQIARAKWKLYIVSKKIESRCGCGTSFSFEKKTIPTNLTKIHRLQNALKLSPEIQKIQKIIQTSYKK